MFMQANIVKLSMSHKRTRGLKETSEQGALGERKKDKRRYAEMKRIRIYYIHVRHCRRIH